MHELGVKKFFDVHGEMGLKLVNVDGHEWPKRAAITINELRDAIVSSVRKEKAYNLDIVIRRIVREVLKEEGVMDEIIDGIHKAAGKNGFDCFDKEMNKDNDLYIDYKGYYECLPILIDFIKEEVQVGNKKARNTLKKWDDNRPGKVEIK